MPILRRPSQSPAIEKMFGHWKDPAETALADPGAQVGYEFLDHEFAGCYYEHAATGNPDVADMLWRGWKLN